MRRLIALGLALPLTGCQPPGYDITAKLIGGQLVFEAHGDESWPFGWKNDTISAGTVSIFDREGNGWVIYLSEAPGCDAGSKTPPFPLTYGKLPKCYREKAPAAPIRSGVAYKIEAGAALRYGHGAFRVTPAVSNLESNGMGVEGEEWPPENRPDYLSPDQLNGFAPADNTAGPDNASG
jgi:hypothetical protein